MKRFLFFLIIAVAATTCITAKTSKEAVYVINGAKVENFDGSQLVGKTIVHYSVDTATNVHNIVTSDVAEGKTVKNVKVIMADAIPQEYVKADNANANVSVKTEVVKADEIIYIVNGKAVTEADVKSLSSQNIVSMEVIKDKNNADYVKYAKDIVEKAGVEPKCVIKIITK